MYIYTGDTTIDAENCMPLLIAATQYELPHLVLMLETVLIKNLDETNVCDLIRYRGNQMDDLLV